ncbi:ribosome rescue GTPase HflX [Candidatus Palibaumannia cicadellinicola]|uniref:GTPase HflX n=1 Tax=Candidatus Palibaumannia cicadellinicola TaxID=186490 RepID=A0A0K2BLP5_9GAMM|nr:ribosome rescue GTPase HflX [Candidatus Baumannia cicadellinicola]AKZ66107.1 GTP-binding protein [Candidatus Baumannia cicadellinicola]
MLNCYYLGKHKQAILVHICFQKNHNFKDDLDEFESLVCSAGVSILNIVTGSRNTPNAKYFVGEGKANEIAEKVKNNAASIVIFNHSLSPAQERNLELLFECSVIDRTGLILSIFAQRARTNEGKLQVELAQLSHQSTRLVRGWKHLERQKGGIGLLSGPGETQLETDRRLLRKRINTILLRIKKLENRREQGRLTRASIPTVLLVGYTNAGKSTLFNYLTKASVETADKLFTTLDTKIKNINIKTVGNIVLADTVGFIRDLPHHLVASFQATLKEIRQATLLLHVVDASDNCINIKISSVEKVLAEINANLISKLLVMNKIDKLNNFTPRIDRNEFNNPVSVWLSAQSGHGISLLLKALEECLVGDITSYHLCLPPRAGRLLSYFYQLNAIEKYWIETDGSVRLIIRLPKNKWFRLCKQEVELLEYIV